MKRAELEHAIVTAANLIQEVEVLVIGSQSILGTFNESELPLAATMSQEVDIAPLHDDERESLATQIDAGAGEMSPFDIEHGFYVQGVSVRTAFLPEGWAHRVVRVIPREHPHISGLCLDVHDLCAAKLGRSEQKDREFVAALVKAQLVDPQEVTHRIALITDSRLNSETRALAMGFLAQFMK